MNNLKTKVHELDVGKLETVPIELKKLSDAVDHQVAKNRKFTKVNNLDKRIPDATTSIHINQYQAHKQNFDEKRRC